MPSPCAASSTSVMGQEKNTGLTIFFFGYCHVFLFVRSQHFFQMFDLDSVRISENNKIIRRKTNKKNYLASHFLIIDCSVPGKEKKGNTWKELNWS